MTAIVIWGRPARPAMRALPLLALGLLLSGCLADGAPEPESTGDDPADASKAGAWSRSGHSTATRLAACLPTGPDGCLGYHSDGSGEFVLEEPRPAVALEASWQAATPAQEELQVTVSRGDVTVASAAGPSPLALRLGDLPSGSYRVTVFFTGPVGALVEQDVAWAARSGNA